MSKRSSLMYEFASPLSVDETTAAVITAIRVETADVTTSGDSIYMDYLDIPPLAATVYFSTVKDGRVVVTAGNRVSTYWQMTWDMVALKQGGVFGSVNLDRPVKKVDQWMGDVMELRGTAMPLYQRYGFRIVKENFW